MNVPFVYFEPIMWTKDRAIMTITRASVFTFVMP